MNTREKKLLIAVGVAIGVAICAKTVYPKWVAPMFDYDKDIARLKDECDDLEFELSRMEHARETYREYVYRTGGTDTDKVGDLFKPELNGLLKQCRLNDVSVGSKSDRTVGKGDLIALNYSVTGEGPLDNVVRFLKCFYEMPYIMRFKTVTLTPEKSTKKRRGRRGRRSQRRDVVKVSGHLEVLVLPAFFGGVKDPLNEHPSRLVKYRTEEFAWIAELDPFNRPEEEHPVVMDEPTGACCVNHECVVTEVKAECDAMDGDWFENMTCPAFQCPEASPEPSGWTGDPERDRKRLQGCYAAINAVQVHNGASNRTAWISVGEPFDGGDLIMVHPYGVLVRRKDGSTEKEYVYPQGEVLADAVALVEASNVPQLRAAAYHFLVEEKDRPPSDVPEPRAAPADEYAGPPEELSHSSENEGRTEVPVASRPVAEPKGPSPSTATTELAGPPEELAGPILEEEPPAKDVPPSTKQDSAGKPRDAGNKPRPAKGKNP